jgi:hypothetical protein
MKTEILIILSLFGIMIFSGCIEVNNSDTKKSVKPDILEFKATPSSIIVGDSSTIYVNAREVNDEMLSYYWWVSPSNSGKWLTPIISESVRWQAPLSIGNLQSKNHYIYVRVQNEHNKTTTDSTRIIVNASDNPIVTITSPQNGAYIPMSAGSIHINATSSYSDLRNMKLYVNGILKDTSSATPLDKVWNITQEEAGSKIIQITATRVSGYTGSATVTISLEGTIGKPGMEKK